MNTSPELTQILEAYQSAVADREVGALMALYAEDVRIFDAWGVWSYVGAPAWRKMVEQWFGSLSVDHTMSVSFEEVQTLASEDLAVVTAFARYAVLDADGTENHAMHNRISWTLRRSADGWKIVHEHTSVPVGFEDSKAILQR